VLPILNIGPFAIPTYPFLLLIAYWAGMSLAARRADKLGLDGDYVYNAGLFGLLAGIVGARLWFVLSHWENYAPNITQAFSLSRSALSASEGLIIAGLVVLIYLNRKEVPLGPFFDAIAPGLAVAITSAHIDIAGTARHPIQIYEAIFSLISLAVLLTITAYRPWPGFHFWLFVTLYGLTRLILEIFRARPIQIGDGFLAVQLFALVTIVIALAVMAYNFNHHPTEAKSSTT
jgi:phosphatidylglycerol:prolipoprotein diacylglycerol transferase